MVLLHTNLIHPVFVTNLDEWRQKFALEFMRARKSEGFLKAKVNRMKGGQ